MAPTVGVGMWVRISPAGEATVVPAVAQPTSRAAGTTIERIPNFGAGNVWSMERIIAGRHPWRDPPSPPPRSQVHRSIGPSVHRSIGLPVLRSSGLPVLRLWQIDS